LPFLGQVEKLSFDDAQGSLGFGTLEGYCGSCLLRVKYLNSEGFFKIMHSNPLLQDTIQLELDEYYLWCLINLNKWKKISLYLGKLKNTPDSHEHRSQVRHLSHKEVASMEKEDRNCSQAGEGSNWEGTPDSFLSMEHSCKQSERYVAPSMDSGFSHRHNGCGHSCNDSKAEKSSRL
jgi:hypothetical protein